MYSNKFVVAVKYKGKILREVNDIVHLPFGSDYSILLKNKNSVKAVASIEIDGVDVMDNTSIIIGANCTVELKGFMKGSSVRNRFRFIEKNKKISKYRGDRLDDGLVRVEYRFEKPPVKTVDWYHPSSPVYRFTSAKCVDALLSCNTSFNDKGITVKGQEVRQDFIVGSTNTLEHTSSVIVLQLRGKNRLSGNVVKKPLTVKTRVRCSTCGTRSKSSAKFCRDCGTFLG